MKAFPASQGQTGGAALSQAWEAAGGTAVRLDTKTDSRHVFKSDPDRFWANEMHEPADVYAFGFPCTSMSLAHSTPGIRNAEYPYGWGDAHAIEGNELAFTMVRRALALVAVGACVIIENPFMSSLWLLDGFFGSHRNARL